MWKLDLEKLIKHERINSWDEEFVILVYKDIKGFLNEKSDRCVLIFPPLNNRRRYFIHKVGELFNVQTFSVGDGFRRLTVVCASDKIEKQVDEEKKVMDKIESKKGAISKAKRASRPDAPIYIPPAIRRVQKAQLPDNQNKTNQPTKQSNRQKDNKKQTNNDANVTVMCNTTQSPEKSNIEDVNIKPDSSDLCTSQLANDEENKFESNAPVVPNVNKSKSESNVPERNVISLTSKIETSTILNENLETQSNISGHIVPSNSQNITENQENDREIIIESQENILNCVNIANADQNVHEINIETKLTNSDEIQTSNNNKADNNDSGVDKKELWANKNHSNKDNDQEQEELLRASEEINRKNKRIIKQSFNNSDILIISNDSKNDIPNKNEKEAPVDCWEDLLDGGKLDSALMLEIIDQVGNVNINKAKEDYSDYKQKTSLEGDYAHVLEIYDFPKEFQTRDLVSILDSHKTGTYHIKWVDDNHALGVFSSGFVATEMLKISHPLIKMRPMTEASKQSIGKLVRYPNAMMPTAVRPQTCAQTARRMVTGALGLKLINAKEERAKEIKILKEAREKKRLSARQQDDAWEGKPSSN